LRVQRPDLFLLLVIVLGIGLVVGLTWGNHQFAVNNPGGADFLPRWAGVRNALTSSASPYSPETTAMIRRVADQQGVADPNAFDYPYYALLVFLPFGLVRDYLWARAVWMTALEVALLVIAVGSVQLARWRPQGGLLVLILALAVSWYPGVRAVLDGNAVVFCALFLVIALLLMKAGNFGPAGIFLALATFKPQVVILAFPFVLYWAVTRGHLSLVASSLTTLAVLLGASFGLQPDWLIAFLRQVVTYAKEGGPHTPGAIFAAWWPEFGVGLGWLLTVVLILALAVEWFRASGKEFRWFYWMVCFILLATTLVGIPTRPANYVALFPALVLVFARWEKRFTIVGAGMIVVATALVAVGLWAIFVNTTGGTPWWLAGESMVMYFPLPLFLLVVLYWVRWWAIRPQKTFIEQMKIIEKL
jgi:hypothetical protein